jgi:putative hemolysin
MLRQIMTIVLGATLLAAVLGGCRPVTAPAEPAATDAATPAAAEEGGQTGGQVGVGIANPASVFCADNGGTLEIRDETDGQVGYCVFDDGSECEEWAYLRGECAKGEAKADAPIGMPNPASVHCTDNGGKLEIRQDANGGEYGMCVFADGSECEEWAFFRGECAPGSPQPSANMPNPASVNCTDEGGTLEIRQDANDGEFGMCVFADNTECEEWALLRGTCAPGQNPVSK